MNVELVSIVYCCAPAVTGKSSGSDHQIIHLFPTVVVSLPLVIFCSVVQPFHTSLPRRTETRVVDSCTVFFGHAEVAILSSPVDPCYMYPPTLSTYCQGWRVLCKVGLKHCPTQPSSVFRVSASKTHVRYFRITSFPVEV